MDKQDNPAALPAVNEQQYKLTMRILKHYREYSWEVKILVYQASEITGIPFTENTAAFIDDLRQKASDGSDNKLLELWNQISVLSSLLASIDYFSDIIRKFHPCGETYYWILYHTYLSPRKASCTDEILELLEPHCPGIPLRTYFRKRKSSIELLASFLIQKKQLIQNFS